MTDRSVEKNTSNSGRSAGNRRDAEKSRRKRRAAALLSLLTFAAFLAAAALVFLVFCIVCRLTSGFSRPGKYPDTGTEELTSPYEPQTPYGSGFLIDVRGYEEYISPSGGIADSFLTVVNEKNRFDPKKTDIPGESVTVPGRRGDVTLNIYAGKALEAMLLEMEAEGVATFNSQTKLGLAVTAGYSPADLSDEHCLGLTVDMHNCNSSDVSFSRTEAYAWLSENCWRFGFIVRYPENSAAVTGVSFRPWQFRFVGRYHARAMRESGLCLEEYTGTVR